MITFRSFVLLALCQCALSLNFNISESKTLASEAIKGILQQHFARKTYRVDVIYHGSASEPLVGEILRSEIPVGVSRMSDDNPWQATLNASSVLIFDAAESFMKMCEQIEWQTHKETRHEHLVHASHLKIADLELIRDGFSIDNVNFLVNETTDSIDLVTGFMFEHKKCRRNQFATINRFMKSTMRWEHSGFYQNKYRDFHGCQLILGREIFDLPAKIVQAIQKSSNFRNVTLDDGESEEIELYQDVSPKTADYEHGVSGFSIQYVETSFFLPLGELYTPIEKLFLPFDYDVWVAIFITLLIGLAVIQIINCCSEKVQDFVYGTGIRTPTVNLMNTFLTGGQYKVPGRNFARFFLLLFSIWCLIIRTCYQSEEFKHLQGDERKPGPKTFADLVEQNFTFFSTFVSVNTIERTAEEQGLPK